MSVPIAQTKNFDQEFQSEQETTQASSTFQTQSSNISLWWQYFVK